MVLDIFLVIFVFLFVPFLGIVVTNILHWLDWCSLAKAAEANFLAKAADNYLAKNNLEKVYSNYKAYADVRVFYPCGFRLAWRLPNPVFRHFIRTKNRNLCSVNNRYYGIGDIWFPNGRVVVFGFHLFTFTRAGRLEDFLYYVANNNPFLAMFFADNLANVKKAWRNALIWYSTNSLAFLGFSYVVLLKDINETASSHFLASMLVSIVLTPIRSIFNTLVRFLLGYYLPIPVDDPDSPASNYCCRGLLFCTHLTKDVLFSAVIFCISFLIYLFAAIFVIFGDKFEDGSPASIIIWDYFWTMWLNMAWFLPSYELFFLPAVFGEDTVWNRSEYFDSDIAGEGSIQMRVSHMHPATAAVASLATQDKMMQEDSQGGTSADDDVSIVDNPLNRAKQQSDEEVLEEGLLSEV
eukprot:gene31577-38165_t